MDQNSSFTQRPCRKCLLRDMPGEQYFRDLKTYINNLDPHLKVDGDLYEKRLKCCSGCDQLLSGMCRICGCFVELRAAMKKNRCPKVHPLWEEAPVGDPDW